MVTGIPTGDGGVITGSSGSSSSSSSSSSGSFGGFGSELGGDPSGGGGSSSSGSSSSDSDSGSSSGSDTSGIYGDPSGGGGGGGGGDGSSGGDTSGIYADPAGTGGSGSDGGTSGTTSGTSDGGSSQPSGDTSGIYADPAGGGATDPNTGAGTGDTSGIYADPAGYAEPTQTKTYTGTRGDPGPRQYYDELGGDPAGSTRAPADATDPGDDRSVYGVWGAELGGDPAGDTRVGATNLGDDRANYGVWGAELGGDPTGGSRGQPRDRFWTAPGFTRSPGAEGIEAVEGQGLEQRSYGGHGARGSVSGDAYALESRLLEQNPGLSRSDIAIVRGEDGRFDPKFTTGFTRRRRQRREALDGARGRVRQIAINEFEDQINTGRLESYFGARQRLEDQILAENPDLDADSIEFETSAGRLTARANTGGGGEGAESESPTPALDSFVEYVKGLGVAAPEYETVRTGAGPGGTRRRQTGTTRLEVSDVTDASVTVGQYETARVRPGPGGLEQRRGGEKTYYATPQGPVVQGLGGEASDDLFDYPVYIPQFAEREVTRGPRAAPREKVGKKRLEDAIEDVYEEHRFEFETLPAGEREHIPGPRTAPRERVPVSEAPQVHQDYSKGIEAAMNAPLMFGTGAAKLVKDAGDVTYGTVTALSPEFGERERVRGPRAGSRRRVSGPDFERVKAAYGDIGQTGVNAAALGASSFLENPRAGTARLAGTLVGSGVIFGGAAAIGSKTSLATRALIQPGEELAGIGGYSLVKPFSPRLANRAFPGTGRFNREPILLSEESAIRGLRYAGGRLTSGARWASRGVRERAPSRPRWADIQAERRGFRLNYAAFKHNLKRRGRGDKDVSFRQRAVGGDLEAGDVQAVALEETDVPTRTRTDAEGEAGGDGGQNIGGGAFEVEYQTESGVVTQRVRSPPESEGAIDYRDPPVRSELRRQREAGRRETATAGRGDRFRGSDRMTPSESTRFGPGDRLGDALDIDQRFRFGPGELEMEGEAEAELEREGEMESELELLLEGEGEFEQELEFEGETEQEAEVEPDYEPRRRRKRDRRDDDFDTGFATYEAPIATAREISRGALEEEAGIGDFDLEADLDLDRASDLD